MLNPTVAVVGASSDPAKYGNLSLRAHVAAGYTVYPVNPRGGEIEGLEVYASLDDVPVAPLDRVTLYVPPAAALAVLEQAAKKGCAELWLNPGVDTPEVIAKAHELGLNAIVACSMIDAHARTR
ncbi:MAG: CoA-binding protein [Lacipirellulaceae bacterium]